MDFEYNHALIPSGIFVQQSPQYVAKPVPLIEFREPASPLSKLDIQLCNPMPIRPVEAVVVQEVQSKFAAELQRNLHRVPIIGVQELYSYAERLLEIGRTLATQSYDIVAIPLRGGLKPWLQLDVLREFSQTPLWLPYTAGSQGKYDEQILHVLEEGLSIHASAADLRIAVVDTAISGDGSLHLAELLARHHRRDVKRRWACDFHLLYAQERYPAKAMLMLKLTGEYQHDVWQRYIHR